MRDRECMRMRVHVPHRTKYCVGCSRSDSGSPDSDRKNQATSSQKSESPPRDAPDSPQRDEAMPAATVTMDTSRGRPQTRERYPDDRAYGFRAGDLRGLYTVVLAEP